MRLAKWNHYKKKYGKLIKKIKPIYLIVLRILKPNDFCINKRYGDLNQGRKIYVIRTRNENSGLGSLISHVIENSLYAEDNRYIPVVDFQNYKTIYLSEKQIGKVNAWELYFQQLTDISVDETYNSSYVILSDCIRPLSDYVIDSEFNYDCRSDQFQRYKMVCNKYIRITTSIQERINNEYRSLIGNKRALGVLCRGTDYVKLKPYGHPVQPSVDMVIERIETMKKQWDFDIIYLATEDSSILEAMKARFGDSVVYMHKEYYSTSNEESINESIIKNHDIVQSGADYMVQIGILTRCVYAILSMTSILPYVMFNSEYEDYYIWKLGKYGIE